ncbi:MAG TPA: cytochrome c biogenesis protein CcdA [Candidatus Brocadiia bacterium]|nr:cytochrome c biogenesis protein CcdA [Candidatus Brocadiia bacterium]
MTKTGKKISCFAMVVVAAAVFIAPLCAQGQPFFVSALAQPQTVRPGDSFEIAVSIKVPEGHNLYRDKCSVRIAESPGLIAGEPVLPPGRMKRDEILGETLEIYDLDVRFRLPIRTTPDIRTGERELVVVVGYQGCAKDVCFPPAEEMLKVAVTIAGEPAAGVAGTASQNTYNDRTASLPKPPAIPADDTTGFDFGSALKDRGLVVTLGLCFVFGFGSAFTGCIYPLIPITLAVIGAKGSTSHVRGLILSTIYVFGISVTYALLGLAATMLAKPVAFIFQMKPALVVIGLLFAALSLSMLGAFTIQLPAGLRDRIAGKGRKGYGGALALGLVSGLVISPCVGPVLMSVLAWVALSQDPVVGFLALTSFAWGMGLPLIVFGAFAGLLQSRPSPGPWLDAVKHAFGALILIPSMYFLRQGLPDAAFRPMLAATLVTLGVFAGAFDPIKTETTNLSRLYKSFGLLAVTAGICALGTAFLDGTFGLGFSSEPPLAPDKDRIAWTYDVEAGLKEAADKKAPLIIDFTADWCTICKRMEKTTFVAHDVVLESRRFVAIRVDLTGNNEYSDRARERFSVVNPPAVLLIPSSGDGKPVFKRFGEISPEELAAEMRKVM